MNAKILSPHFSRWEFTVSQEAVRHGIPNEPSAVQWDNLEALALTVLEPTREICGPIHINSGYRSPSLNALIGGAAGSQHMLGEAADIIPKQGTLSDLFKWMYFNAPFDQIIWEFGAWVHVSHVRDGAQRGAALIASRLNGKTVYAPMSAEQVGQL